MPSWGELLNELQPHKDEKGVNVPACSPDELRNKYIKNLSDVTSRNVIIYYSGWLKAGRIQNVDINDGDMTGFMNVVKGLDCSKGLDLILHTPGGNPTATEGIVKYLHKKFNNDIRVIVPQMAMSAGTMLACSSQVIVMGYHSCLGPIDPQFAGTPAYNIMAEFQEAKKDIEKNIKSKEFWKVQLEKYPPAFFYSVIDAINLSSTLTSSWLNDYMFKDEPPSKSKLGKIKNIVSKLNSNNQSHSRHFTHDFCKEIGLNIKSLEDEQELQEAVLSVHHAAIITFDITNATKIIENQNGARYISSQQQ